MALHFEQVLYQLTEIVTPAQTHGGWDYRFTPWPDNQVLRSFVDYQNDSMAEPRQTPWGFVKKFFS